MPVLVLEPSDGRDSRPLSMSRKQRFLKFCDHQRLPLPLCYGTRLGFQLNDRDRIKQNRCLLLAQGANFFDVRTHVSFHFRMQPKALK